ncbi:MAG: adenylosuccinate synthase [Clostridiales bacterium]|jgi:adenylosuccinate synthase|nr:adenylosuccinate synthase [Clostridiales bacterium]
MLTAVVGINWGDEGKGRMVDLLSEHYDVICRYQGGNNAGHTVVNDRGKFILNILPSGVLRDGTVNVLGTGMVLDLEHLMHEMGSLQAQGVEVSASNLKISNRATICFPYHKMQDVLEEDRLKDNKYGSTRRGIAPVYADKYIKKGLRMGDLLNLTTFREKLKHILDWKNLILRGVYGETEIDIEDIMAWITEFGAPLKSFICDTGEYLEQAVSGGKNIIFEAQLGALRDIDYGIYPFTTSSQTLSSYATTGAGIPWAKLDNAVGIVKAYSSCVGEGPFVCEMFGIEGERLREAGSEYGAATGRPRRVGGFDVPASKYGVKVQGASYLALTKLDVLTGLGDIPVCVAYEINGKRTTEFPIGDDLTAAKPIFETFEGFNKEISNCRKMEDLPKSVRKYIDYLENALECEIKYISVGERRGDYIER